MKNNYIPSLIHGLTLITPAVVPKRILILILILNLLCLAEYVPSSVIC